MLPDRLYESELFMIIDFNLHPKLGEGVYAHVFHIGDKAYKLFLAHPSHHSEEKRRSTFRSECEAYRRASSDPDLKNHVATFYGTCAVDDVIGGDGQSTYMSDCCYVIEALSGSNNNAFSHVYDSYFVFREKGLNLSDADVFNYEDPGRFKFIDFEVAEKQA
jgi:hypothetical protein